MEYWIVYDIESGAELYRGSGSVGTSAFQQLPESAALVVVPLAVVARPVLDLAALRVALSAKVDVEAESVRMRFLTAGAGQAKTYQRKEAEARAWIEDNSVVTPFLSAEAPARGMTVAALAAEVVARADAWTVTGSTIEALRLGAKDAIEQNASLGAIIAASTIDWSALGA
ncbi:hypothetical protein [Sphingomonas sp.]|uniref:hypothetical protein n=1 Tax=Sphingomonas sp. TaxID=28214 RepID=UPI002ED95018